MRFLIAGIVFILLGYLIQDQATDGHSPELKKFESVLHKKELQLQLELDALADSAAKKSYAQLFLEKPEYYSRLYKEFGYVLLVYENDTLKFWSDNSAAVENQMKTVCLDDKLAKLRNGWFEVIRNKTTSSTKYCIGLLLVKNEFPYQNAYLLNDFQKQFSLPADTRIIKGNPDEGMAVHNHSGEYLFTLKFNTSGERIQALNSWPLFLDLAGIVFILGGVYLFFKAGQNESSLSKTLLFTICMIILRAIMIRLHLPAVIYSLPFFGPLYYGDATTFWLPSLGDLLMNTLFILLISLNFSFNTRNLIVSQQFIKRKTLFTAILLFVLFSSALIVNKFFLSLIENSNISFNINNFFSLSSLSYTGFIIVTILQLSFFLVADRIIQFVIASEVKLRSFIVSFLLAALLFSIICHLIGYVDWVFISKPMLVALVIYILKKSAARGYSFPGIVLIVFIFSIYSTHTFIKQVEGKEHRDRMVIAEKIAEDKDPLTEHLFTELETKLGSDSVLIKHLLQPGRDITAFEKGLRQNYFSGYWDKYAIRLAVFDTMCNELLKPPGLVTDNNTYYDDLIQREGQQTTCEHFYFLKNSSGKISYMTKLPLYINKHGKHKIATIYAGLDTRFLPEEIGFPELLLDRNMGIDRDLFNYSYAKYRNNELISQYGKYQFSLKPFQFLNNTKDFVFKDIDGYNHLSYCPNKSTVVVISQPSHELLDTVTSFSYLFSFFSLVVLVVISIRQVVYGSLFKHNSFKYRIQFLFIVIVLISLVLFGTGTIFYIKAQFEVKNSENISEKINSVAVELESKLGNESRLNAGFKDYSNYLLKKLSSVFFTDVNIYDLNGNIYASSQPKIFEEGLASRKMNPDAYLQMAIRQKTQFIHDEEIGNLEYLSAYVPFKGKNGELLAYLNLPYFAKQTELEKEIAAFLEALINIYVVLFALSVLMAIFISNYVTRPLKLIQDKLGKIQLGKANEPIDWADDDEIGNLVKEYNRMIEELTKSADLLARSERESAWREMAKQVAHEIKNPLTPMKLSVQHLQRMWNDKSPDMDDKIQRITATLIEQIDTLSSIAGAFSSFAKMPKPNNEKVSLDAILQSTVNLFKEQSDTTIQYVNHANDETFIFADKEQLLRVFNNLLKNAIQSIPEKIEGKIIVELTVEDDQYVVKVKDNGNGISDEVVNKIFTPNFTTKSTGMGLGLAMAKSIVESSEGKIWFETKEGKGTTFYVSIPAYK